MSAYHCLLHTCILVRSQHLCSTLCPCWGALNALSKMIDCLLYWLQHLTYVCPGAKRRSRASMLQVNWMEAESFKSSCCRRRRMDEDCMTSNKTGAAERRRHVVRCRR